VFYSSKLPLVKVRLSDGLALSEARTERYRAAAGRDMIFGIRPEHFTEPRGARDERCEVAADHGVLRRQRHRGLRARRVVERRGPGQSMRLCANVNHMHLIDPDTKQVI
jgi:multiple sugar transport system ATP-binding protein